ncbi:MAG: phosphoglucosamine mutase [Firmicutes bacterium]|nr:phosphoglucosamine mutase [Bacillota bacterium]
MSRLFGTDGVRGVANADLSPELAFRLGRAAGYLLAEVTSGERRPAIGIGKDTRASGDMLEAALIAGLCSSGVDVLRFGVITTPGVAYVTRRLGLAAGAVISASHNPVSDNGIKFFGADGFKLSDEQEDEIAAWVDRESAIPRPIGVGVGRLYDENNAKDLYLYALQRSVQHDFRGLHVVLDCANGAAFELAPQLFRSLGARVTAINTAPTGGNINVQCGSTYPQVLQEAVRRARADVGFAFDGDADRCIAADAQGEIVDGDSLLYLNGVRLAKAGHLPGDTIVITVMSNLGLRRACAREGIRLVETQVGDKYVMQAMRTGGYALGGEQSGHLIFLEYATTGDGMLTALQTTESMLSARATLAELVADLPHYPQMLVNVPVTRKEGWEVEASIVEAIRWAEEQLRSQQGRLLVRPSGTEPLLRVMAEGPDEEVLRTVVGKVADSIAQVLGTGAPSH